MKEKLGVSVEVNEKNQIEIKTNIDDKMFLRAILKAAEEIIVADALKKASVQQQVIPVRTMPRLMTKPS